MPISHPTLWRKFSFGENDQEVESMYYEGRRRVCAFCVLGVYNFSCQLVVGLGV